MGVRVFGASDDLIEIDGDLREEFPADRRNHLVFSDGTILNIEYGREGIWAVNLAFKGTNTSYKEFTAFDADSTSYSDVYYIGGYVTWVHVYEGFYNEAR